MGNTRYHMGNTTSSEGGPEHDEESEDVIDGGRQDPLFNEKLIRDFAQSSGMTVEQVKDHLRRWFSKHRGGKMARREFREILDKAIPKLGLAATNSYILFGIPS